MIQVISICQPMRETYFGTRIEISGQRPMRQQCPIFLRHISCVNTVLHAMSMLNFSLYQHTHTQQTDLIPLSPIQPERPLGPQNKTNSKTSLYAKCAQLPLHTICTKMSSRRLLRTSFTVLCRM